MLSTKLKKSELHPDWKEVNDTRIFDTLKARVTVPHAATRYGIRIGRNGMCCCPFHSDKTPSMKINETYYYCFGCHSTGDVIDFTARLFDLCSSVFMIPQKPHPFQWQSRMRTAWKSWHSLNFHFHWMSRWFSFG